MASGFRRSPGRRGRPTTTALLAVALTTIAITPLAPGVAALERPALAAPALTIEGGKGPGTSDGGTRGDDDPNADAGSAGLEPSVQYEEATAHAHDRIAFTPGARVAVGFTPRPGDRWSVGDATPTTLPGGRLDGRSIRTQKDAAGSGSVHALPDRSIDLPTQRAPGPMAIATSFEAEPRGGTLTTQAVVSPAGLRREVFGFLPYWQLNSSSLRLDYSRISTIAYFGVGADAAGNLQKRNADGSPTVGWSGWTSSRLTGIISAAHRSHTRVVLTVQSFGWTTSMLARQKRLLGSATARTNLARQIAAAVRDRGADGVNLDFEPLARGYESEFTSLVRGIRGQLNRIHRGYQVTFDTTGSIGNYPIEAATASGGADAIFIMGYDYRGSSSSPVGSVAPYQRTGYDIVDTVRAYVARVSPSKLILGVPYYGRAWSTSGNGVHASNISSVRTGASTTVIYDTAADYLRTYGRQYDPLEQVAWTAYRRRTCTSSGCVTPWRQLYIDDATALARKYDLVNAYDLRGAGIWALGYDGTRPELSNAIKAKFMTDTTPPSVGVVGLPPRAANPAFVVRWSGVDDVGIASYDAQVSIDGGRWTPWVTKTAATSAVWRGLDGHGYAFRVRARDRKGNTSAWNVGTTTATPARLAVGGFGIVRRDGLIVRASADTSARKVGTVRAGARLAIVGGPRTADGSRWFQVTGPLTEWNAVRPAIRGGWIAVKTGSRVLVAPTTAPNGIRVAASLGGLVYDGAGATSIGPSAAAAARRSFSPNGDRSRDGLRIDWTNARTLSRLVLRVFRSDGRPVGDVPVNQRTAGRRSFTWNGLVGGRRLPDGSYLASLVGTAGGVTYFNPSADFFAGAYASYRVTVDTVAPVVRSASTTGTLLSPNRDGIFDSVRVSFAASGATGWAFGVAPMTGSRVGAPVLIRSGSGGATSVAWTGLNGRGAPVPDGTYRLQLLVADVAGNRASRTWTVRLDRTVPRAVVTAPARFSPNGDGDGDSARLAWSATEAIIGTVRVYHGSTVVRSWPIHRVASGAVSWNGRTSRGSAAPDGRYSVRVTGRDAAGNATATVGSIVLDRTLSSVRWKPSPFAPQDGDAIAARSTLSFRLSRTASVTAGIYAGPQLIRTIWTNRRFGAGSHAWSWDGRNAAGTFVPGGIYQVRVTATTGLGSTVQGRTILADAFNPSLSATSVRAGQTLTATFTSVEALKYAPSVTFSQPGRNPVRKTATSLGGGRYRVSFVVASARAGRATIVIAGRDRAGGLNVTTRAVTMR